MSVRVEIHALELLGRHGVNDEERSEEQRFLFDVELTLPEPESDDVAATVDYRDVRDLIRTVSDARSYSLLESLASATADAIAHAFAVEAVRVRVRKPGIAWAEWTAATVDRVSAS